MAQGPHNSPHEEEIVPVRPGLGGGSGPKRGEGAQAPAGPRGRRPSAAVVTGIAGAVLLAAVIGVFVLLPGWVEQRNAVPQAAQQTAPAPEPAEPEAPALTEEELAALRDEADGLLADLLTQQQRLDAASAESWGEADWQLYEESIRGADDAYLAEDFKTAVSGYTDALGVGERLLERSAAIVRTALNAGQSAIDAGNAELAVEQFDLVLRIDADNEAAQAGRARAGKLPDVLDATRRGDSLRQQEQLGDAAEAYRAALALDPDWAPARRALESVEQALADRRFEALMSEGHRALANERYDEAAEQFRAALAMRPNSAEARDGIAQAEQGMHLDQIALAEARALAFERRELWQQAIEQYRAALETDDSLAFAKEGLDRARSRADLDAKLANLIENPNLLFADDVLASAKAMVEDARSVVQSAEGDSVRLRGQIDELTRLIELASTPVTVPLMSDGLTHVTLYRVGELGAFETMQVDLRPGNYTALGSRRGYRDVRRTFTVLPGREPEPISVICIEPI